MVSVTTVVVWLKAGPNVDLKKWQDEQIDKATVRFSARDAKERSKVSKYSACNILYTYT